MRDENFDRELDAMLKRYAAVEPRRGLEERVLANLRAEPERGVTSAWWHWPIAAAAVVMIAIVAAASLRYSGGRGTAAQWTSESASQAAASRGAIVAAASGEPDLKPPEEVQPAKGAMTTKTFRHVGKSETKRIEIADSGSQELTQFPSREPLSEQEKLLLQYVRDDPANAELVAEAMTLAEQVRIKQASEIVSEGTNSQGSER